MDITTDPIWEGLAECGNLSLQATIGPRPCAGFLSLQWVEKRGWCDKHSYNCADRSDEGGCAGYGRQSESYVSF